MTDCELVAQILAAILGALIGIILGELVAAPILNKLFGGRL